jgi:hypothetical protein
VQLVNIYNIGKPTTLLVKNVKSAIFEVQQLVTNFSSVFVIPVLDHATIDRLNKVHNKKTKMKNFAINF